MKLSPPGFYPIRCNSVKGAVSSLALMLLALTLISLLSVPTLAADKNLAATSVADVDEDFHSMGEYQGWFMQNGMHRPIGLQVVALGNGEFSGMQYGGGLPGTGWNRQERAKVEGKRKGDVVKLNGIGARFEISNGMAKVFGYDDTHIGNLSKLHRRSPTLGQPAPPQAIRMFDGTNTDQFKDGKMTPEGLLKEGTEFVNRYSDFTMHVEYCLPYMPYARGQGRANSGLYLQSSYEVQILDSFGLEGVENECGALYRYKRPDQNMCLPPLSWQTYDLTFHSPKFDSEGKKIQNARIMVLHNGVPVQNNFEVQRKTGAGQPESAKPRPIKFQNHSNPVRYRNIWLIDLTPKPAPQMSHAVYPMANFQPYCVYPTVVQPAWGAVHHPVVTTPAPMTTSPVPVETVTPSVVASEPEPAVEPEPEPAPAADPAPTPDLEEAAPTPSPTPMPSTPSQVEATPVPVAEPEQGETVAEENELPNPDATESPSDSLPAEAAELAPLSSPE